MRDVSRFYSSSHDRFTYGSSFINFNLPQFYQIVEVDGRTQVIPFRTQGDCRRDTHQPGRYRLAGAAAALLVDLARRRREPLSADIPCWRCA